MNNVLNSNSLNQTIMREYTAKYNTKSMKGVEYSFKAENLQEAIKFAQDKFSAYPEIEIFDDTDTVKACAGPLVFKM